MDSSGNERSIMQHFLKLKTKKKPDLFLLLILILHELH